MKLSFHGAVRGVTGSCFLVEHENAKILIDCGMYQGGRMCSTDNFEEFGFNPSEVDAVLITHAHFDHTGRLALLVKRGFRGKVYSTPPTKALSRIVLDDALNVMSENARECGDPVLYNAEELDAVFSSWSGMNYHTQFEPAPGIIAMFHDVGHILGSSYVTLDVEGKRVLFSGDVGNEHVPILPPTEPIERADIIVTETTYGNRDHEPVEKRRMELLDAVNTVIGRGGTLIIPSFAIERTQELLYELDALQEAKKLPRVPVYLDSPLAIRATEIYRHFKHYLRFDRSTLLSEDMDFFSFPGLRETLNRDESKAINADNRPKIIIAGSGMMTGGRVLHHARRYLPDAKNGLLIIGYQAEGTLGRQILEGAKRVQIYDTDVDVRAEVREISSFSAHADRAKLASWLVPKQGGVGKIFLVHGEAEGKESFKNYLRDRVKSEIIIPGFQEEFTI